MINVWNLGWLNHNAQRAYPLSEDATRKDTTGTFSLPDSFLVDFKFAVSSSVAVRVGKFYVSSIAIYGFGYNVVFSYSSDQGPVEVGSVVIAKDGFTPYSSYEVAGKGVFFDSHGYLTIGTLEDIDKQPAGVFSFALEDGLLEIDCFPPQTAAVNSIVVVNGGTVSDPIQNDIQLVAGNNTRLTVLSGNQIQVDFIEGISTLDLCACEDTDNTPPIRRINSIGPTPSGDFYLSPGDCVRLTPITNGLKLEDTCSSPCCGPSELSVIQEDLKQLGNSTRTLQALSDRLASAVDQLQSTVLASRLGDAGCVRTP